MSYESIEFKLEAGVARLTLNRPERLNAFERALQRECGLSEDYKEGVSAFKARRTPNFTGR
ncbi:MAG TPA: hypothetical protein VNO35_27275 [Steroidobacteraceae bacterium]|nr:hypothetical protein [Steroidobacteraceae bacterium]